MCGALEHESLRLGQPGLHQLVHLYMASLERVTVRPKHGEERLCDAPCIRLLEALLLQRWNFNSKERVGVGRGLREGTRQHPV